MARREHRQRFWVAIARGMPSEDAGIEAGVSPAAGTRWFRHSGGIRPVSLALSERMEEVGLRLHPDKTKVVYCKERKRRLDYECTSFTFPGYTFRVRKAPTRDGRSMFAAFLPAISGDALKDKGRIIRRWRINLRTASDLAEIAEWMNPIIRGWMNY